MPLCPKCGSMMVVQRSGGKRVWVCKRCGYMEEGRSLVKSEAIPHSQKEKVVVVEEGSAYKSLPKVAATCPECGYNEAYYWMVQTRRADEGMTRFYRCVRCGKTWREYH
ncbi:MAG: transcription factor S [Thermoprotei archaeon]|nr:MAG: transcription factor S [Thermoprotei archaeon]RLF22710.1 MAG: transcription factor S [Thermoprotei archaeon]